MGKIKDKFIKEQELHVLDSLHDSKYWEVKDVEYEHYINSEQYFIDLEDRQDEDEFIKEYVKENKSKQLKQTKKCVE